MCGIAGKMIFSGDIVNKSLINKMCNTLVHRGPDDEGVYTAPYIGLGQRRLSIIDLSRTAAPPLANEDETVWLVFNGEIYNFISLRKTLVDKGHIFKTHTDTEVIIHLYEEYGIDCLKYLRGMFSFALWDAEKKRLFAARDHMGKKPFYYTKSTSAFIFGSEIKAITADPEVSVNPDYRAIDSYLTYQYVPSPLTAFSGIYKLPPAHYLLCDSKGTTHIERFWVPTSPDKIDGSPEEIQLDILAHLAEAVRMRMISDVPLGAFLSGGIDSGIIVALMAIESSKPVKTFSIGFEESEFNELPYARLVAERYGTEHHELIVKPNLHEVLPLLVKHYNEPFADSSAVPTFYVSKMTREHVTVALSGDGGDESFAGYSHYSQMQAWERFDVVPVSVRKSSCTAVASLLKLYPKGNLSARADRALTIIGAELPERYQLQMATLKPQEKQMLYTESFRSLLGNDRVLLTMPWNASMDSLDWMMRHDLNYYLPDCLMVKTDRASMANSLEVRCPFLDHAFVEYAATIPSNLKRDNTGGKIILKKAAARLLPPEILHKKKSGFGIPLANWFRGELSGFIKSMLLDNTALKRGLFEPGIVKIMIEEHIAGKRDWSNRLWALLFLEMWFREFID